MKLRRRLSRPAAIGLGVLLLLNVALVAACAAGLRSNRTVSMPKGVYRIATYRAGRSRAIARAGRPLARISAGRYTLANGTIWLHASAAAPQLGFALLLAQPASSVNRHCDASPHRRHRTCLCVITENFARQFGA